MNKDQKSAPPTAAGQTTRFPLYDLLLPGEQNAIKAGRLADLLGLKNTRDVATECARERNLGKIICSSGEGYYLPACTNDVVRFVRQLEARARNTLAALRSAKGYIREQEAGNDK